MTQEYLTLYLRLQISIVSLTVFKVTNVNFNDSGLTVVQVAHAKSMVHDCLTLF